MNSKLLLRKRGNLKSDISILLSAHVENIYFNPLYYETFIKHQEDLLKKIAEESQFDHATIKENDEIKINYSMTPSNYLNNPYGINLFGY